MIVPELQTKGQRILNLLLKRIRQVLEHNVMTMNLSIYAK